MPFSDEDLYIAVSNYLPTIEEYIKSHEGTMRFDLGAQTLGLSI